MKYNIWDIVLHGDKSIFCEYFPEEVKIMSSRKLWLFWFYYFTRVREFCLDWIHEYRTKRIYEKRIEKIITKAK